MAKIQDESEKSDGEVYDFQCLAFSDAEGEIFESNEALFERINNLYRRALRDRMYITDPLIPRAWKLVMSLTAIRFL